MPRKVRRVMTDRGVGHLVLAIDQDPELPVLRAYLPGDWNTVLAKLAGRRDLSPAGHKARRRFRASGEHCQVDKVGRLLIPQGHRDHLGLSRKVVWTGQGTYAELYRPEVFQALQEMNVEEQALGAEEIRDLLEV